VDVLYIFHVPKSVTFECVCSVQMNREITSVLILNQDGTYDTINTFGHPVNNCNYACGVLFVLNSVKWFGHMHVRRHSALSLAYVSERLCIAEAGKYDTSSSSFHIS
jgi:hypothetical protein